MQPAVDFQKVAQALRETFGGGYIINWSSLVMLLVPALAFMAWLWGKRNPPKPQRSAAVLQKDLDFFDMVRQQKGLEKFDRDLLMELAEIAGVTPVYAIILEEKVFDAALKRLEKFTSPHSQQTQLKNHLTYLFILKKRLFGAGTSSNLSNPSSSSSL